MLCLCREPGQERLGRVDARRVLCVLLRAPTVSGRLGQAAVHYREQRSSVQPVTAEVTAIRPFRIEVPEEELAELRRRIEATRWPSQELVADRSQRVQLATLQTDPWGRANAAAICHSLRPCPVLAGA
jgi:hypothetical protein